MPATSRARAPAAPTEDLGAEAARAFTDDKCAAGASSADSFFVGGILPLTGNLAFLGPPAVAGVGLAVSDINAAGGVNGAKACHSILDSGDSTDMSISTGSAGTMVAAKPSVVIGAESSSVSLNFVDTLTPPRSRRSPRPTPRSTCPATRRSTSAPPRRTRSRATRSAR